MEHTDKPIIRSLREDELDEAHYIVGFAFSQFMGIPDWRDFQKDGSYPHCRFPYNKNFAAEYNGKLVGLIFAFDRGNLGIFGTQIILKIAPKSLQNLSNFIFAKSSLLFTKPAIHN